MKKKCFDQPIRAGSITGGFTLIELSIVLVIIGLIVGGIMVGKNLIRQTELKSILIDKDKYITAAMTFRDKYGALPSDLPNATTYWGAARGSASDNYTTSCIGASPNTATMLTCNGLGTGYVYDGLVIQYFWQALNDARAVESVTFWQHLANAGLIPGLYSPSYGGGGGSRLNIGLNIPRSRANSNAGFWVFYMCFNDGTFFSPGVCGHYMFYGAQSPTGHSNYEDAALYPTLSPAEALSIDTKADDGNPATGLITALPTSGGFNSFTSNCTTAAWNSPSTAQYNMASPNIPACSLIFKLSF